MSTSENSTPPGVPAPVERFVQRRWPGVECRIERLTGDASTRAYFRLISGQRTYILASYGTPFEAEGFPFLETTRLLEGSGVAVPNVLAVEGAEGLILLDDLGDRTLQIVMETLPEAEQIERFYRQAVDLVVRLQRRGTPRLTPEVQAGRLALDGPLFRKELDFFFDNVVIGLRGQAPDTDRRRAVAAEFDALCSRLEREPRVLCHRDYHSRNLMVGPHGDLTVLDHQDARGGPDTYDLVSLLRDPYVILQDDLLEMGIEHYRAGAGASEDRDLFRARFDAMAVQRMLKAAGTFAAQKVRRGRTDYLRYLPRALDQAARSFAGHAELAPLRQALIPWVPELA